MRIIRLPLLLSLLMLAWLLGIAHSVMAIEDTRAGCDSCLMKVNSLDKPFNLVGTWLFTREDVLANKDPGTDTSNWKLSRAPGSWKKAYNDGKNFKVGWFRGNFIFDKSLIGQEVVLLIDTYMGRTKVYLDGQEIYQRGDPNSLQRYYATQAIPVRFKITQPRHMIAIRIDTLLMIGVYQLPFQLRAYSPTDHTLAFASLWGGEFRMIAAHVIVLFGFFFLLVYFKTRYLLYLIAAGACITIYPFYAYPGDIFLKFFKPETMLLFHYIGIGTMGLFHYYFAQFFYKATPRLNIFHGMFIGALCLLFIGLFISFNLDIFQIARSAMLLYSLLALAIPYTYFYIRGILEKRKYALTMAVGEFIFVLSAIHDVLLALGKIDSMAMIFGGSLIATSAMLWVSSNMFADTFVENKRINANLELIVTERTNQLRQSEEKYRTILENIGDGYYEVDLNGNFIFFNDSMCRILGYSQEEMMGMNSRQYTDKENAKKLFETFTEVYKTGKPAKGSDWHIIRKDGTKRIGEASVSLQKDSSGNVIGFRGITRDITERKQAEEMIRQSEERYRTILDEMADAYFEVDIAGNYTFVNDACCRHLGYPKEELIGVSFRNHMPKEDIDTVYKAFGNIYTTGKPERDISYKLIHKDGTMGFDEMSGFPLQNQKGEIIGFRGIGRDITERKRMEEEIQYQATHDALTGLSNRMLFSQMLNHAIQSTKRHQRQFAVLFIDLDRFKTINDTLGHEAGDQLLQEIATRLKQTLRAADLIARLGGDEFIILIEEVSDANHVATVAHKIITSIIKPITIMEQECRITASIGICMYPKDAEDEQTLMKNADMAMYLAKEEGKNNYQFYSEDIQSKSLERLSIETNLRNALERNELSLHYQAKVDFKTNAITGVEALLRWENPYLGFVTPTQFIPVAEETGLIVPIGNWVLRTACAQNVAWQRQGLPPVCMAVNLSMRQLTDDNLIDDIRTALNDSGMAPNLLELEITESMVMHNPARMIAVLAKIKSMGVRLAIDDFGTGYSSLAQIKHFPVDTLKVDRSFIRNIPQDAEDKAITEAIIAMGKTLSLTVVAEGVETEDQMNFLNDHSCDEMQGYYFSKPIIPDQFADLLRKHVPVPRMVSGGKEP